MSASDQIELSNVEASFSSALSNTSSEINTGMKRGWIVSGSKASSSSRRCIYSCCLARRLCSITFVVCLDASKEMNTLTQ
jgi:hypothetical protein